MACARHERPTCRVTRLVSSRHGFDEACRRHRRRRRQGLRRRDDVHPVRRPRLPAVRRGGPRGRCPSLRRPARAERGLRRRGHRQADPRRPGWPCSPPAPASPTASAASPPPTSTAPRWWCWAAGRPQSRWGSGALQELDHPPLFAPITKLAVTVARRRRHRPGRRDGLPLRPSPRTAARSSSTSTWTTCSRRRRRRHGPRR